MTVEEKEKPLPHQLEAARILGARSILADKRGLGKTWSSLLWSENSTRRLVLARKEVAENFLEELQLRYPEWKAFNCISKSIPERRALFTVLRALNSYTVVMNIEAWRRDVNLINELAALAFDTVIIDEAHSLKDDSTLNFRGTRELIYRKNMCQRCGSLSITRMGENKTVDLFYCTNCFTINDGKPSINRLQMLTGTPILNVPYDLWPLLHLWDRDKWPNKKQFLKWYCYQGGDGRFRFLPGAEREIIEWMNVTNGFMARSPEDAGIEYPPQHAQVFHIDFDKNMYPNQWGFYQELKEAAAIKITEDETMDIVSMLALITRLRQAIVWPAGIKIGDYECTIKESVKLDEGELRAINFIDEGMRVIIASQFTPPLDELHRRFGAQSVILDGRTSDSLRREIRHDFDRRFDSAKWRVLLANYKVGGESLNLNAATASIAVDREWSPGREDQFGGRTQRMGQIEETYLEILRATPSIDDWHAGLIIYKQEVLDNFDFVRQTLREHLTS